MLVIIDLDNCFDMAGIALRTPCFARGKKRKYRNAESSGEYGADDAGYNLDRLNRCGRLLIFGGCRRRRKAWFAQNTQDRGRPSQNWLGSRRTGLRADSIAYS
ncbi:hypothetical protein [Marivivens niveibacter]|uniref:hypothetical protein n=1 Tax=Marivivens niveibacter TaxID=1930667 RepID=UPI001F0A3A1D|nr:hypothetical protein [Marivivens niveibacter]